MRTAKLTVVFCLLICLTGLAKAEARPPAAVEWKVGEELFYSVKWSFVRLGSLRLQVLSRDTIKQHPVYHCRIYIDSNPSLPFVNIHDVYDSYVDANEIYSHKFFSYEQKKDHILYTSYDFDYERQQVKIRMEKRFPKNVEVVLDSAATIPEKVLDSLSMLFFARFNARQTEGREIPVFAFNKFEKTYINFTGEKKKVKSSGIKTEGYYLDGRLKFVGIAGVKEDFKGWFSADAQSVPLRANMKAFIGSVKLELREWKNWDGDSLFVQDD